MSLQESVLDLAVAALGGLAVGIEREWTARVDNRGPRFAGIRTFLLLGLLGGLGAVLAREGHVALAAVLPGAGALLAVAAYVVRAGSGDVDGTTEVAAIVVLATGLLAGSGQLVLASGLFAAVALVLAERGQLHALVLRIKSEELQAGARFAVLALVVLPLLPAGPFGPEPGVRPRELWALVLVFAGVSFVGVVAVRAAGPGRGYGVAGLLGGVVSSTVATLQLARESRSSEGSGAALGMGVLAACAILPLRVLALCAFLNAALARATLKVLAIPIAVAAGVTVIAYLRTRHGEGEVEGPRNPLRLGSAVAMALGFQAVLYALSFARSEFGSTGLFWSGAVLGLTDMDALTYSMVTIARTDPVVHVAARALALGIASNTLLKAALAVVVGRGVFRRVVGLGLVGYAAASVLGLALAR